MSHPPQDNLRNLKLTSPATTRSTGRETQKGRRAAAKQTTAASQPVAGTPTQRQAKGLVNPSGTKPTMLRSTKPESASLPPHKTSTAAEKSDSNSDRVQVLCTELQDKDPPQGTCTSNPGEQHKVTWFDSYYSLDTKLYETRSTSNENKGTRLAEIPIQIAEGGAIRKVGLRNAIREKISFLLGVEAKWNPVTLINSRPKDCLRPLWTGQLWLGGIKDSGNKTFLKSYNIDAVVSIHPEDWLTNENWRGLFKKWDGTHSSLQPGWTQGKLGQYHIRLQDDSSEDLVSYFQRAFCFMDHYLLRGKNILVHCKMGQSRSASLVFGYMMNRYYKTHLAGKSGKASKPTKEKTSEDLEILGKKLKTFLHEITFLPNEDNESVPRTATGKRRRVNMKNFEPQLFQYAQHLANGDANEPTRTFQQAKSAETKAAGGGGIIRDAALVLCFMHNLEPTYEIRLYWLSRKDRNTYYWIAASERKAQQTGGDVTNHLASFNGFFSSRVGEKASSSA